MPGNMFVPRYQNQMMQLLGQVALGSIKHKWDMEEQDRQFERAKLVLEEKRQHEERQKELERKNKQADKSQQRIWEAGMQGRQILQSGQQPQAGFVEEPISGTMVGPKPIEEKLALKKYSQRTVNKGDKQVTEMFIGDPKKDDPTNPKNWIKVAEGPRYKPSTSTTVNIDNKIMPATEVGKTGEYAAYKDTLSEITQMISDKKIDTGPFEFIKNKLDNWGVLPNKDRIKLRTLVARLPGLMYAMRGKQLSDKELEVALKMMPQMNLDETAFTIATQKFDEYMNAILEGKWEAFKSSGYNASAFENIIQKNQGSGPPSLDTFWSE